MDPVGGYHAAQAPVAACAQRSPPPAHNSTIRKDATLLPMRSFPKDSRYAALRLTSVTKTLGSESLAQQVKVPEGSSEEEWLAVSSVNIFNELNLLISATMEWCSDQSCPEMTAGSTTYMWADGVECKTPISLSAPQYCERLLTWVDKQLADPRFLPVDPGVPFPPSFRKVMRTIYKRLFRIYAHMFLCHFEQWKAAEADAHLFHSFKHFVFFVKEFNLIDDDQFEPMKDLVSIYSKERKASLAGEVLQKLAP
eukprot:TRINITY_DN7777_c0_g1_i1.p1 TRINITY_DN7777_c0_g1~~TRINITY_DN7777_c0_g1_i1.p1  ORF type:complete len:281 (-),score=39.35 TRINITY_DN7777_c0_g1_i1:41-799(-)